MALLAHIVPHLRRKCYISRRVAGRESGVYRMSKISVWCATLGLLATAAILPAISAEGAKDAIPNFNPDGETGWAADRPASDDFLPHDRSAGPGPVESDPAHPYTPNGQGQPTYRIADLTNPILQPWVVAQMKKTNDDVLAGKKPLIAPRRRLPPRGARFSPHKPR